MEENVPADGQQDLFDNHVEYTQASQGSRFLNFLIDNLFMRFVLSYATGYLFGYILLALAPDLLLSIADDEKGIAFILLSLALGYFNYLIYYTICEAAFNGYTLGKLITGTRAIRADGEKLRFKDALLRSLSRIVPFEVFSGLGPNPWHDSWTKTTVVKAR
jgi:uncharacterized RDD family membrane protein YckC